MHAGCMPLGLQAEAIARETNCALGTWNAGAATRTARARPRAVGRHEGRPLRSAPSARTQSGSSCACPWMGRLSSAKWSDPMTAKTRAPSRIATALRFSNAGGLQARREVRRVHVPGLPQGGRRHRARDPLGADVLLPRVSAPLVRRSAGHAEALAGPTRPEPTNQPASR